MDYLILLDRKFPYRAGESFLENEIEEIASSFDKVLVYPSDPTLGEAPSREIRSTNVDVVPIGVKAQKIDKVIAGFRVIGYLGRSWERGARRIIDAHFLAEADRVAHRVAVDLSRFEIGMGDTVCIYSYWLHFTAMAACLLKEHLASTGVHCAAISRAHGFDVYEERNKLAFLPQRKCILEKLDHVYVVSSDGTRHIQEMYPEYASKISTAYLGTYDHGTTCSSRSGAFHLVSCSRMAAVKRVHLIAEALELLKGCGIELEWTHIGDGEEFRRVEEASKSLSWMKVNLPGAMPNSEVYNYYSSTPVDLFINVSESEGLPVSIMEAISFGVPVIATRVGGTPEIVVNGVNGELLNEDFTNEELASAILKYASMRPEDHAKFRADARAIWENRFRAVENYSAFASGIKKLSGVRHGEI